MKNHKTNSLETPAIKNHKTNSIKPTTITTSQGLTHTPAISQKNQEPKTITYSDEKIALVLALAGGFAIIFLDESSIKCEGLIRFQIILLYGSPAELV